MGTSITLLIQVQEQPQNGTLNWSFAPETGRLGTIVLSDYIDCKLVVVGDFVKINNVLSYGVAKLDKNGEVDKSFVFHQNLGTVKQVKILYNNNLLVNTQRNFFRLDNLADIDTRFKFQHFRNLYEILKFIVRNDGKIVVSNGNNVYRLNSDGSEDTGYNTGTGLDSLYTSVFDFDLQGDKVIFGSMFNKFNHITANRLIRLNPDGFLDNTFNTGTGPDNDVTLVKVLKSGEMIIGGFFNHFNGFEIPNRLVKLGINGEVDTAFLRKQRLSFFENGIEVYGSKVELIDSMIYVKGALSIAKFNIDGTIFNDFSLPGNVDFINDIVTVKDTTIVGSGKKSGNSNIVDNYIYAFGSFRGNDGDPFPVMKVYLGGDSGPILHYIMVSQDTIDLSAIAGNSSSFDITSNESWNLTCDQPWLYFSTSQGDGNATIQFAPIYNNSASERTGKITITGIDGKSRNITVIQKGVITRINDLTGTGILVYPSPVKNKLYISFRETASQSTVSVINRTGQSLYTTELSGNITEIDMSSYSPGLYFIRIVKSNHEVIMKKVLKQ